MSDDSNVIEGLASVVAPPTATAVGPALGTAFCIASFVSGKAVFVTSRQTVNDFARDHGQPPHLLLSLRHGEHERPSFVSVPIEAIGPPDANELVLVRVNALVVPGVATPLPTRTLSGASVNAGARVTVQGYWSDESVKGRSNGPQASSRNAIVADVENRDGNSNATFVLKALFERALLGAPVVDQRNVVFGVVVLADDAIDADRTNCRARHVASISELSIGLETDYGGERKYTVAQMIRGTYVQVEDH
jgi:hypothetical protein